jgi:hypothetical protein
MSDLTPEQLENWRRVVGDLPDGVIKGLRRHMQAQIDAADPVEAAIRILSNREGTLHYYRTLRQWVVQDHRGRIQVQLTPQQATKLIQEHRELKVTFRGKESNQYEWVDPQHDAEYAQYVEDKIVGGLE